MLVLTRSIGKQTHIFLKDGTRITVSILNVSGSNVKVGFEAPKDVNIIRDELYLKNSCNTNHECKKCNHDH